MVVLELSGLPEREWSRRGGTGYQRDCFASLARRFFSAAACSLACSSTSSLAASRALWHARNVSKVSVSGKNSRTGDGESEETTTYARCSSLSTSAPDASMSSSLS